MQTLTTEQLRQMGEENRDAKNKQFYLFNVLPREEFRKVHLPESLNAPVSEPDFVAMVEQTVGDKNRPVVVYCASISCDMSPKAARKLEAAGFQNVFDYEGGTQSWKEAGLPVAGEEIGAE
jgi:rhodanese-related sulfurtransferase